MPTPLYQGHQFKPAQAPQGHTSTQLPFANEWQAGLHQNTQSLQRLQEALIQRNDDTVLRQQQAYEKQAAQDLTTELQYLHTLADGTPGALYDKHGRIRKEAVSALRNKYIALARNWHKGYIDPTASQKSADSTQSYLTGITKAIDTSILAQTKERQRRAYEQNIRLSTQMQQWDEAAATIQDGYANAVYTQTEADLLTLKLNKEQLRHRQEQIENQINSISDIDTALDLLENPQWLAEAQQTDPTLIDKLKHRINTFSKTTPTYQAPSRAQKNTSTSGAKKALPEPPETAPWYYEQHFLKHRVNFKTPESVNSAMAVMQRYASENITQQKGTAQGDAQWADLRTMADAIGLGATETEQIYNTRLKQITLGGFDPQAYINAIPDNTWLQNTDQDEIILANTNLTPQQKSAALKNLLKELRSNIVTQYNLWYTQNETHRPDPAAQATEFIKILNKTLPQTPGEFQRITNTISNNIAQQTMRVDREKRATQERQQRTKHENLWLKQKGKGILRNIGITPEAIRAATQASKISTDITLDLELTHSTEAAAEPDYKTDYVIYIPHGTKINAKEITLPIGHNKTRTFKVRHANLQAAALSRKAKIALGISTLNPTRIIWDGSTLTFSDEQLTDLSDTYDLFPSDDIAEDTAATNTDDGLVPAEDTRPLPL